MSAAVDLSRSRSGTSSGGSPTQRKQGPRRNAWLLGGVIFLAVMGSALGLTGTVRGWSWLGPAGLTVGGTVLVMAAVRAVRVPAALVPLAGLVTLTALLTLQFFPATALGGVLPTGDTIAALDPRIREMSRTIVGGLAPVEANPGIKLLICAGLGLVVLLVDGLAIGLAMPAVSGLGLLAAMVVPALVKIDSVGPLGFTAGAIGYLLLLGVCQRDRAEGPTGNASAPPQGQLLRASVVGAGALAVVLAVSVFVPGFNTGTFPQGTRFNPFGNGSGLNPLVTLGADLRSPAGTGTMTYATNSHTPVYLRSTALDDFTGGTWSPDEGTADSQSDPRHIVDRSSTAAVLNGTFTTTRVDAQNVNSPWLPAPYAPLSVTGLRGEWTWNSETLSIKSAAGSTLHQTYLVHSVMPSLSRRALADVPEDPGGSVDPKFLALPGDTPAVIASTARKITTGTAGPYDKAMALQDYLRSSAFTYSEQTPLKEGYDGSGLDVVAKFLEVKSGYCVHFSAAMAVMAREVGIPSRIAVGYAPGKLTGKVVTVGDQELTEYSVDGHYAHSWPELYFSGLGWVPFEPTPGRGQVPAYAQDPNNPATTSDNPNDAVAPGAAAPPGAQQPAPTDPEPQTGSAGRDTASNGAPVHWLWPTLAALVLAGLLGLPAASRLRLRRRRGRGLLSPPAASSGGRGPRMAPPELAWAELLDLAEDYGHPATPSETPRGFTSRLATVGAGPALQRVTTAHERSLYGPPTTEGGRTSDDDLAGSLRNVRNALAASAGRARRLRARVLPPSTLHRWSRGPGLLLEGLRRALHRFRFLR